MGPNRVGWAFSTQAISSPTQGHPRKPQKAARAARRLQRGLNIPLPPLCAKTPSTPPARDRHCVSCGARGGVGGGWRGVDAPGGNRRQPPPGGNEVEPEEDDRSGYPDLSVAPPSPTDTRHARLKPPPSATATSPPDLGQELPRPLRLRPAKKRLRPGHLDNPPGVHEPHRIS